MGVLALSAVFFEVVDCGVDIPSLWKHFWVAVTCSILKSFLIMLLNLSMYKAVVHQPVPESRTSADAAVATQRMSK